MPKIKEIHDRLIKNPAEYSGFSFLIAMRIFLLVAALYFFTRLMTVGGFYLPFLSLSGVSMLSYHLYSLLIIAMIWFGFAWTEYIGYIYFPSKRWISLGVLLLLSLIG